MAVQTVLSFEPYKTAPRKYLLGIIQLGFGKNLIFLILALTPVPKSNPIKHT
jgi:hypothetical protein